MNRVMCFINFARPSLFKRQASFSLSEIPNMLRSFQAGSMTAFYRLILDATGHLAHLISYILFFGNANYLLTMPSVIFGCAYMISSCHVHQPKIHPPRLKHIKGLASIQSDNSVAFTFGLVCIITSLCWSWC